MAISITAPAFTRPAAKARILTLNLISLGSFVILCQDLQRPGYWGV